MKKTMLTMSFAMLLMSGMGNGEVRADVCQNCLDSLTCTNNEHVLKCINEGKDPVDCKFEMCGRGDGLCWRECEDYQEPPGR